MVICSYVLFWLFNLSSTETQIEISVKIQWHCRNSPEGGKNTFHVANFAREFPFVF